MIPYPHLSFCMIGVGVEWSNRTSLTLNISHWVFVTTHASGKPDPFPIRRIVSPRKHMAMKAGISQQAAFLIGRPPEKFRFFCSFSTTTNAAMATKKSPDDKQQRALRPFSCGAADYGRTAVNAALPISGWINYAIRGEGWGGK